MMPYYVYLIKCRGGSMYCGYTSDPVRRFDEHVSGKGARYTRMHKPITMCIIKMFRKRSNAMRFEREVKRLKPVQKRKMFKKGELVKNGKKKS